MSLGASFAADPAGSGLRSRSLAGAAAASVAVAVAAVLVVATLDSSRRHLETSPSLYGAAAELIYESNGTFAIADADRHGGHHAWSDGRDAPPRDRR